jgi:hypothetical protein
MRSPVPNLAAEIEDAIRAHRLRSLDGGLPEGEFILPHYAGLSIANFPATTAALLGVTTPGAPPLPQDVWGAFAGGVRCVVRVIVDALGYYRLGRLMAAAPDSPLQRLLGRGGQLIPLTSVCPSTTTTALSSLWTGRTPAEHGMLGTRLFLRERGLQANMIYFNPVGFERRNILLEEGMEPAKFLPVPGIAEALAEHGIETHVFINEQFNRGGLSDIFFRGVKEVHNFVPGSGADLWITLRRFLEERAGQRLFISTYWGLLDGIGHRRGPSSPAIDAEMHAWTALMEQAFLQRLSPAAAAGTVLTLLADHGQVDTPPTRAVRLDQHPGLLQHLLMKPLGEKRLPYLFARQGQVEAVRRYVREQLGHAFVVLDSAQALEAGLFGPGQPAPETPARLGDLILVSRQDHLLYDEEEQPQHLGLHGGLSPEEMLVPCLLVRLDG